MPINTRIDTNTGFRRHNVTGEISRDDIQRTLQETYSHPDFRQDAGALWDFTKATGEFPTEDIRHLADFVGRLVGDDGRSKVAIVVPSDFEFGMARMYETILSGQASKSIMFFQDVEEAKSWLDEGD
jgi:hypothetical protein